MATDKQKQTSYPSLTQLHAFIAYEAIKRIALSQDFNNYLLRLKKGTALEKETNPFLHQLKQTETLSLDAALIISVTWREIIDHLMQTTLKSIMIFSDKMNQVIFSPAHMRDALQTGLGVFAEEYDATLSASEESLRAPTDGLNSMWWDMHIVQPLLSVYDHKGSVLQEMMMPQVQWLLKTMDTLSKEPLGFMVQLGVAEPMAHDVMLGFLPHLTQLEQQGRKIFNSSKVFSIYYGLPGR